MVESEQNNSTCIDGSQCLSCGYDLRALDIDGSCPECGTSIELSMRGNRLSLSDPAWVAKLASGQSLLVLGLKIFLLAICIGLACFLIGIVGIVVWSFAFSANPAFAIPSWVFSFFFAIVSIGLFVGIIITTIGCALITTQDPRDTLSESLLSNRNVARWALFAIFASVVISSVLGFILDLFFTSNFASKIYASLVFLLLGICLTVSIVAILRWLASLAVRIPDHELRKRTLKSNRFFQWAILVFIILNVIIPAIRPTPVPGAPVRGLLSGPNIWFDLLSCSSLILVIVILIKASRLYLILREYRTAFRKCAAEAASTTNS